MKAERQRCYARRFLYKNWVYICICFWRALFIYQSQANEWSRKTGGMKAEQVHPLAECYCRNANHKWITVKWRTQSRALLRVVLCGWKWPLLRILYPLEYHRHVSVNFTWIGYKILKVCVDFLRFYIFIAKILVKWYLVSSFSASLRLIFRCHRLRFGRLYRTCILFLLLTPSVACSCPLE